MNLEWIKQNKMVVVLFGAAAVGYILYTYIKGGSNSVTASGNSVGPQYLVPVVQTGSDPIAGPVSGSSTPQQVAPNGTTTTPTSNTTVSQATSLLQTAIQGKAASTINQVNQGGSTVGVAGVPSTPGISAIATPVTGLNLAPGSGAFVSTVSGSAFGAGVPVSTTSYGGANVNLPTDPTYRGYLASIGSPGNPFNYLVNGGSAPAQEIVPGIPNPTNNMIALATEGVQFN